MRKGAWSTALLLVLILALAFGLRLAGLGRQSLWYDEGVSAYLTTLPVSEMLRWTAEDIQPPLYYALLAGWTQLFGRTEAALRWPSALFSLLTVGLAWLAGRRLHSARAGLLAALFFALSPLYLWYAQEARNYALLTFLGLLASVLLYDLCAEPARRRVGLGVAYALTCIAALYTHYFALFLLAAHLLYYLASRWAARQNRPAPATRAGVLAPVLAWVVAGLAYLPWLPYQLGRLGADESYWRGALKLGEALRKGLISFSLGETVLEGEAWPWALAFLAILLLCVAVLLWAGRRRGVFFLLCYLLVPAAGVLALALRVPKFNVRYLMPASPAFLLLLACGLAELSQTRRPLGRRLLAGGLALFVLAGFVRSDCNLYFDAAFSKADFRGVAAHLRAQRQPDEAILLVSGHMFPVFDYYLPGSERILLPAERTLSTEKIVTFESAGVLRDGLAGKAGVWVVRWQDEVVDPNDVVGLLLDSAGERQPTQVSFWQVRLDHYRLPASAQLPTEPPITTPAAINFGGLLELAGWSQPQPDQYVLYWRALQPVADDLSVSLRLIDAQGLLAGQSDGRPAAYLYPTMRWKIGEIVPGRGKLPALPGSPPGDYWLDVLTYAPGQLAGLDVLDAAGAPQGKSTRLGPFRLEEAGRVYEGAALALPLALDYQWDNQLALGSMSRLPESVSAGQSFTLELGWHCLTPTTAPWSATVRLRSADPNAPIVEQVLPLMQSYPTDQWRAGEWVRSSVRLRVPAGWPAGPATALLTVAPVGSQSASVELGRISVAVPPHNFSEPTMQMRLAATADGIRLAGYSLEPARPIAGEPFTLTLVWQAERDGTATYTVFVHVLEAGGARAAQADRQPADGARPTTGWVAGEYIIDAYSFNAYPSGGSLAIGMYADEAGSLRRLNWMGPAGEPLGDALRLPLP